MHALISIHPLFVELQELSLKIAHLTDNAQARRRMLDHETMETHTAQVASLFSEC